MQSRGFEKFEELQGNTLTPRSQVNEDLDEHELQEESLIWRAERPKRRSISSRATACPHDLRTFSYHGYQRICLEFCDRMNIRRGEDDVQGFGAKWDEVLLSMREAPMDVILESVCITTLRDSVKIPWQPTAHFSFCTRNLLSNSSNCLSKTYTFVLGAEYLRSLLCACAAQTSLILCDRWCVTVSRVAAAVLGKKSRCVSIPLSSTAHLAHSVFGGYRRHTLVTSCEPTYSPMTRRNLLMRSGQATPIPPGRILSRSIMNSSLPSTSFVMISWKPRIRHLCKMNLLAGGNPVQLHMDHEDIKTFSWEWNHKNWASEE